MNSVSSTAGHGSISMDVMKIFLNFSDLIKKINKKMFVSTRFVNVLKDLVTTVF